MHSGLTRRSVLMTGAAAVAFGNTVSDARAQQPKKGGTLQFAISAKTPHYEDLKDRVDITVTDEGLRIELREAPNDGFFDSGSAVMKPVTITVLSIIAEELKTNYPSSIWTSKAIPWLPNG